MMARDNTSRLGIDDLIGDKRRAVLELAEKHGATKVRVFGSVARSEAGPESDIDLLVDFRPGYTLWDQIGLKQDLEDLLGRPVELVHAPFVRDELAPTIFAEAVAL